MPKRLVISPGECRGKRWRPPTGVEFATNTPLIPLNSGELAKAATSMPLAAVKIENEWDLVGVCGLEPTHNLYINGGNWMGHYRPQWLATFPFEIVEVGDKGLVTFNTDSGLLAQDGGGEPFFDEAGHMAPALAQVFSLLQDNHRKRMAIKTALKALAKAKVLAPWPEALQTQANMKIEGLHYVDEKALSELDDAAFLELRRARALAVAYAINLSIPQVHLLARLDKMNPAVTSLPDNLDRLFDGDDGNISFGNLH